MLLGFFVRPEPAWGTTSFYSSIIHACPVRGPRFNPLACRKRHIKVKKKSHHPNFHSHPQWKWENVAEDKWGAMDSLTQYFLLPGKRIKLNTVEAEAAYPAVVLYIHN